MEAWQAVPGLLVAGVLFSAAAPKRFLNKAYFFYALAAAAGTWASLRMLTGTAAPSLWYPVSNIIALEFKGGAFSAFFSLILSVVAFSISLYSVQYTLHARAPRYQGIFYGLFLFSLYAVFFSSNVPAFLISWEAMSLVSYFLVVSDTESDTARRAGLNYAVMTHIGTAFLIFAFMYAYAATGSMEFSAMQQNFLLRPELAGYKWAVFLASFIGFGVKAGVVPLHVWLPRAHPAAPSNVSALMSGLMIKTGIYGMCLMGISILGGNVAWWGVLVLIAGAVSSVLGVLYALMEHDIKRLLAYHSVENIGIILLGLGSSMLFASFGLHVLAALALAAGLYHTLNHGVFKALLFMGAGSVLEGTGTKDMEKMGGLIKVMPVTGLFFLVGSISICALPPFNGFVSEWLTFQSLILGTRAPAVYAGILSALGGAALALTGALAAACFIKVFGISFLGMPRSAEAARAKESGVLMGCGMGVLAVLCLLLGIFPGYALGLIGNIQAAGLDSVKAVPAGGYKMLFLNMPGGFSTLSTPAIFILFAAGFACLYLLMGGVSGRMRKKILYADSWDCGIRALAPRMQYTATAFTKPLRVIFKRIYMPRKEIRISYSVKPFFAREIEYHSDITPFIENFFYSPFKKFIHSAALRAQQLQSGSLHLYLGYILLTLVTVLFIWG